MASSHIGSIDNITSTSASSSPPSTPPRRGSKYPLLLTKGDPSQVPPHRQDTSHTYERLEDLLREAGYAETRVFTPQAERILDNDRRGNPADNHGDRRSGVVRFLAGLIPGASKQDEPAAPAHDPDSPLAHKVDRDNTFASSPPTSHFDSDSGGSSTGSSPLHHNTQFHSVRHNRRSMRPHTASSQSPSAARALLRHISSTPNIPAESNVSSSGCVFNGPGRVDKRPSMPSAWLSTVKHAVINSNVVGAHIGGPHDRMARFTRTQSKENDGAFATQSRGRSTFRLQPPQPTSVRVASPGPVNLVSVVCRSAPGSRSSSLVRGTLQRGTLDAGRLVQELKGKGRENTRRRKRLEPSQRDSLPSLLASMVDGDVWFESFKHVDRDEDEDDEEGELNLAKLLVPPKRQQSIRSLRRHLDRHSSLLPTIVGGVPGLEPWRPEDDSEDGPSMKRGRRQASPDETDFKDWGTSGEAVKKRSRAPNW